MRERYFYGERISAFLKEDTDAILGQLSISSEFADRVTQKHAWQEQIRILKQCITGLVGFVAFEYNIPRMGKRVDTLLVLPSAIVILEFKVGEARKRRSDQDQAVDYALDLSNFQEKTHQKPVVPVLVATEISDSEVDLALSFADDLVSEPLVVNARNLKLAISHILHETRNYVIDQDEWLNGRYSPSPSIIEAAIALFQSHTVEEITRNDALGENLNRTRSSVEEVISSSKLRRQKSICFVTGVPGAGKTLVGLEIANKGFQKDDVEPSVFLSGNGPLVSVLQEALAMDHYERMQNKGVPLKKGEARSKVKVFVQNVHHYRDEYLKDRSAPIDHVAIFDEAQRAWNREQTVSFMKTKKGQSDFQMSEPEFLISCLDRHDDWAVVICLVGGGQEINRGEAGISEWLKSIQRSYPDWNVYISDKLHDEEYASGHALDLLDNKERIHIKPDLHLSVSMRSFRSERLSSFVKALLDLDQERALSEYGHLSAKYPIYLTRDVTRAKRWLRSKARGSERYGMVVSSNAERLKPLALDVKSEINPVHYFLKDKSDVRSSYYMEAVATEFHIQGLELDWCCLTWDGDFRYSKEGWNNWQFRGSKWQKVNKEERREYQKNAYRVLMTRARQGMIIVVPHGDPEDHTRLPKFYDPTYQYLKACGIQEID